jgi:O-antigen ligase
MSSRALPLIWNRDSSPLWRAAAVMLRPFYLGLIFPSILYVAAMTIFLFRPPDLFSFYADRIAFGVLVFFVSLRAMALRQKIPFFASLSLPMLGLMALAVLRLLRGPFDAQLWSIVASKYIVPFTLFHLAVLVFRGEKQRRHFAVFAALALVYLTFIAIAFLADARSLIVPRFILDQSLGFHPDRARGPFLQAVANGVSLNILGILVLALWRKRTIVVGALWLALSLAILATMTRAVWISFAVSAIFLGLRLVKRRLLATCALLAVLVVVGVVVASFSNRALRTALGNRTEERGPVDARMAVYTAGWAMFQEHPFTGWRTRAMYSELARRMSGYHLRIFYVHNTYLALLVEFGVPGLALYVLLFVNLYRLCRKARSSDTLTLSSLRQIWPILLGVYLFNAFFVDMAYQFVIGLVFTVAGMLCASEESTA